MTDPLDVLIADGVIDEVLGRLKSGKEANISLIRRGDEVLAAKVYKDRSTRSFKNNADYKEGRKVRNTRTQRAMDSGGRFGRDAAEQAWKSAEADALYKLVDAGVRVPAPVMFYEGVLLMELVKDAEGRPAPRLIDVALEPAAALGVYADLLAQMISMLCCDLIHGDLSPYNILAAADGPTIIDFPQVVSAVHSSRAEFFFLRDFDNVVRFVSGFDPALAIHRHDGRAIWRAYVARELTREFVPPPPPREMPRSQRAPQRWNDGPPREARGPQRPNGGDWNARSPDPRRSNRAGSEPSRPQGARPDPRNQPAPANAGRRNEGSSRGPDPRRSNERPAPQGSRSAPQRDPRSNPPRTGARDPHSDPSHIAPQEPRSNLPRVGPQDPRRHVESSLRPPRDGQARPSDRSGDRNAAPARQPSYAQPRDRGMPTPAPSSAAPSRGRRRRPKRHW